MLDILEAHKALEAMPKVQVTVPVEVGMDMIENLLVSAFEGGYSPWILEIATPTQYNREASIIFYGDPGFYKANWEIRLRVEDPEGSEYDPKGIRKTINLEAVKRGLITLATKYPHHWANIMADNTDALTGDALVQCCVFDEIIYG